MTYIVAGVFLLAVASMRLTRYFGLQRWQVSLGLGSLGVILYVLNCVLVRYYISKRAPELASNEEVAPGVQTWELTAGLGMVPKWVSLVGLLAISALITAVLPWIFALLFTGTIPKGPG